MKRILVLLIVAAMALFAVGCSDNSDKKSDTPATEAGTQLHTIPPTEQAPQIEWAPVDCEIELQSNGATFAGKSDFKTFALVGSSDSDCELRFKMDDEIAKMLAQLQGGGNYTVVVNNTPLSGELSFSDDYSVITVKGGSTFNEMCELANTIRGITTE